MHELLKPYCFDEFLYIPRRDMIALLKQTDNAYYIDDLNYLTCRQDDMVLCGYFPGTDPARNFCYIDMTAGEICFGEERFGFTNPPKSVKITCRDFELLRRYLKFFGERSTGLLLSLNVTSAWEEAVGELLAETGVYEKREILYDMRFPSESEQKEEPIPEPYRVVYAGAEEALLLERVRTESEPGTERYVEAESMLDEIRTNPAHMIWTLYENDRPLFTYNADGWGDWDALEKRIGYRLFGFGSRYVTHSGREPEENECACLLRVLCRYYGERGYFIRNITLNERIMESESVCRMLGMERYRMFVYLREKSTAEEREEKLDPHRII